VNPISTCSFSFYAIIQSKATYFSRFSHSIPRENQPAGPIRNAPSGRPFHQTLLMQHRFVLDFDKQQQAGVNPFIPKPIANQYT